jgi:hypothetical protein
MREGSPRLAPFLVRWHPQQLNGMTYIHAETDGKLSVSQMAPTIPETVCAMFQVTFAIITPAPIVGAFADRMKFSAMLLFLSAWSLLFTRPSRTWCGSLAAGFGPRVAASKVTVGFRDRRPIRRPIVPGILLPACPKSSTPGVTA